MFYLFEVQNHQHVILQNHQLEFELFILFHLFRLFHLFCFKSICRTIRKKITCCLFLFLIALFLQVVIARPGQNRFAKCLMELLSGKSCNVGLVTAQLVTKSNRGAAGKIR